MNHNNFNQNNNKDIPYYNSPEMTSYQRQEIYQSQLQPHVYPNLETFQQTFSSSFNSYSSFSMDMGQSSNIFSIDNQRTPENHFHHMVPPPAYHVTVPEESFNYNVLNVRNVSYEYVIPNAADFQPIVNNQMMNGSDSYRTGSIHNLSAPQVVPVNNDTSVGSNLNRTLSIANSPSAMKTSFSSSDGCILLREFLLDSGEIDFDTGYSNSLLLQGLWGRIKTSQGNSCMVLALRLENCGQTGASIINLKLSFMPNSFGLSCQADDIPLPNIDNNGPQLLAGHSHTYNLPLFCSSGNQKVQDADFSSLSILIEYQFLRGGKYSYPLKYAKKTFIPMHIFFQDHPQLIGYSIRDTELSVLSTSEEGPRLDQTTFLDLWPSSAFNPPQCHQFEFSGVNWMTICNNFVKEFGHLKDIPPSFSSQLVIKAFEYKLSVNRIYIVATRETPRDISTDLVFFTSFRLGEAHLTGCLCLAEIRLIGGSENDKWAKCFVHLKMIGNPRLFSGIEMAIKSILQ